MTLFSFVGDLTGIREALERIALALEKQNDHLIPSLTVDEPVEPPKTELHWIDPRAQYQQEVEEARKRGEDPEAWAYMPPQIGRRSDVG